jgi:hypothetical protein
MSKMGALFLEMETQRKVVNVTIKTGGQAKPVPVPKDKKVK